MLLMSEFVWILSIETLIGTCMFTDMCLPQVWGWPAREQSDQAEGVFAIWGYKASDLAQPTLCEFVGIVSKIQKEKKRESKPVVQCCVIENRANNMDSIQDVEFEIVCTCITV